MADEVNTSQGMEYEIATADSGVVKSLDKLCDALNNVYKNLEKIEDASDDAFDAGKVDRMTNSLGKIADQLAAAAQRFDQSTERMLSAMENSSKSSRKSTTRKSSTKSEPEPAEINADDISLTKPIKSNSEPPKQTDSLEIYKQEIDSLFEEYRKLTDKLGQSTSARGMETLRAQIESVIEQLNQMSRLYDAVASRSDDKASIPGYNETMAKSGLANDVFADQKKNFAKLDISEYEKQIQSLMSKLNALSNKSVRTNLDQTEVTRYQELIRQVSELQRKLSELSKEHKINIDTSATEQEIASLQSRLNQIMSGGDGGTRRMKFSMSTLLSMAKQLPSTFSRAFKAVHKISSAFSKIGRFISNCVKRISSFVKHLFKAKKHTTSLGKEFKYFLRMLSSATLFRTFSKITESMAEAKDALARISDTYNAALSKLQTSLNATRNALVSAFAPIQSLFNGPFTSIMALIERAADKIGMAFAALNGQDVYEKLTQDAVNYRDTLEDVNKAQKQVIGGLDELNILQENKDKTDEFNFRVEYVTIDKGVSNVFKRIRELWKSGEYRKTGEFIAQQINGWFENLDLTDNVSNIEGSMNKLVSALNGFFENFDGQIVGEKLADIINGALEMMNGLIEGLDFKLMFSKIGDMIKTFFDQMDADTVGEFITGIGSILIDGIVAMCDVLTSDEVVGKTLEIIDSVAEKINDALADDEKRSKIAQTLGDTISTVINTLMYAFNSIDWVNLVKGFTEALNTALQNIDKDELRQVVDNLGKILTTLIAEIDWETLGQLIGVCMGPILENIGQAMKYALTGSVDLLQGFLQSLVPTIDDDSEAILARQGYQYAKARNDPETAAASWATYLKYSGTSMADSESVRQVVDAMPLSDEIQADIEAYGKLGEMSAEEFSERFNAALDLNLGQHTASSGSKHGGGGSDKLSSGFIGGGGKASQSGGAGFGATKHGGRGGAFGTGRSVADEYISGFCSADWTLTGEFAADGIMQGMDSAFASVQRWGKDFLTATQDVFMIKSPSKLFRKFVGKFLGLGVALGLYDSTPEMLKSVDSASDAMISEFDKKQIRLNKFTARGNVSIPDAAMSKIGGANNRAFNDRQDNNGVVGAIETMTYKIVDAVKEKTTDAYIDGQKVTDNVTARQSARVKMTGKPAMA